MTNEIKSLAVESEPLTDAQSRVALPKQRRFLLLTSFAIIFYYWVGLGVKGAQISGVTFDIARKDHALFGMWLVFLWSLWRYYQRFYELYAEVHRDVIIDELAEDRRLVLSAVKREARRRAFKEKWGGPTAKLLATTVTSTSDASQSPSPGVFFNPEYGFSKRGARVYSHVLVSYQYAEDDKGITSTTKSFRWEWSMWRTRIHPIRAWIAGAVRLPAISEHMAPLLFAAVAMCGPLYDYRATLLKVSAPCEQFQPVARISDSTAR